MRDQSKSVTHTYTSKEAIYVYISAVVVVGQLLPQVRMESGAASTSSRDPVSLDSSSSKEQYNCCYSAVRALLKNSKQCPDLFAVTKLV